MKVKLPTTVFVRRNDPRRDRAYTPQMSERLPVRVRTHTAPHPAVDSTAFFGVGRDVGHTFPVIHRYQALAIADKNSIAAPHFLVPKVLSAMVLGMGTVGGQNPTRERTNIKQPAQTSLGARAEVPAGLAWAPQYLKLL